MENKTVKERTCVLENNVNILKNEINNNKKAITDIEKTCLLKCSLGENLKIEINNLKEKINNLEEKFKEIPGLVKKIVESIFNKMLLKIISSIIVSTIATLSIWVTLKIYSENKLLDKVSNTIKTELIKYEKTRLEKELENIQENILTKTKTKTNETP